MNSVPAFEEQDKLSMALQLSEFRKRCFDEVRSLTAQHEKTLSSLRARKTSLQNEILQLESEIRNKQHELGAWQMLCPNPEWLVDTRCSVPKPMVQASQSGEGVPSVSGIYFVWPDLRGDVCSYVGQSNLLVQTCTARTLAPEEQMATFMLASTCRGYRWLLMTSTFLRPFYIGLLRPFRNKRRARLTN